MRFFRLNRPWKIQNSVVITSLAYFSKNYIEAYNLLSCRAIIEYFSLQKLFAQLKIRGEIFYPKNNIVSYNVTVSNNHYAGIFNLIERKYLSNIPIDDYDFMKRCYVSDRGYNSALQTNVRGFIYDSLTPYFKNLRVKEFRDNIDGGAFGITIEKLIKSKNLDSVMILFGGRGAGKSTFIERLL